MVTMIRSDLDFILAQIRIAEADARGEELLGTYIPNSELPWGLRRVDGSNNNLNPGQGGFGAADQPFPNSANGATVNEGDDFMAFGPPIIDQGTGLPLSIPNVNGGTTGVPLGYIPGPGGNWLNQNDYGVHADNNNPNPRAIQPGDVVDADPRIISNLIADQTLGNPAAIYAALNYHGIGGAEAQAIVLEIQALRASIASLPAAITAAGVAVTNATNALDATTGPLSTAQADYDAADNTVAALNAAISAGAGLASAATSAETGMNTLFVSLGLDVLLEDGIVDADDISAYNGAVAAAQAYVTAANAVRDALLSAQVPNDLDPLTNVDVLAAVARADNAASVLSALQGPAADMVDGSSITPAMSAAVAAARALATSNDTEAATAVANLADADSLGAAVTALTPQQEALDAAQEAFDVAFAVLNNPLGGTHPVTGEPLDGAIALEDQAEADLVAANAGLADILANPDHPIDITSDGSIAILNLAPDVGLSAPFNGWMTLFGQFFDHGLDLLGKGGEGTVYIPLQPDDPLYVAGSSTNFMAVTRATLDENGVPVNKVTPFVDQNQTYTSNASAQVFHREYEIRDDGKPYATGRLLNGVDGGLATWADMKQQALEKLGIELNDFDIHRIPQLLVDDYGNFVPHPVTGFAQIVVSNGPPVLTLSGTPTSPVLASDALATGHAFLDDIAHNANPGQFDNLPGPGVNMVNEVADGDTTISTVPGAQPAGTYDDELLDRHFITGDGRGNENIGLTAVHHVFHSEHNRQIDLIKGTLIADGDVAFLNEWLAVPVTEIPADLNDLVWNGERLFQAAKVPTEMQYQHLVFEEFARTVQPMVNVFNDYDATLNAAIVGEFAHTVYRFGHSMLTESVDRYTPTWDAIGSNGVAAADATQIGLIEAFLNPVEFNAGGLNAEEAAGAIIRGMTRQVGNEIDEFVTDALRNNLVGLPLDLAAINIARGRELQVPTLNEARAEFFRGSGDAQVRPYDSWYDFMLNLKNPISVVNFIAAYGTHASILAETTVADKRDAAMKLVFGDSTLTGDDATAFDNDRLDFINARDAYAGGSLGGLNNVDLWIGGLAERTLPFGGMLGTTFNFVFEVQLEALQNGDRFYYLSRLANLNLTAQLENNKFAEMIARNSDAEHLSGNVFKAADFYLEVDQTKQFNAGLGSADPTGTDADQNVAINAVNGDAKVIRVDPSGEYANYLSFIGGEHVVIGGTDQNDFINAERSEGDNTLWGDAGDDRIAGGYGNEMIFGGDGNDIITDPFGINEIRSNGGDDVVAVGSGVNLVITDTGDDVVFGGNDVDEFLLGQGNDFAFGGAGEEFIIGGEGNDWIESGTENSLLLGDNGDIVQGLPVKIGVSNAVGGHDILVGGGGNSDFDAEAGDDIMVAGFGTERFFGAQGFDWASFEKDTAGVTADMTLLQFAPPAGAASPNAILDRFATTEGLSGSAQSDILRGDSRFLRGDGGIAAEADLGANPALNALTNIDLISGLRAWLPTTVTTTFDGGNILLGGAGSDVLMGNGGDDLLGGDHSLNVRIEVSPNANQAWTAFSIESISEITERMISGEIKVDQLRVVREIVDGNQATDVDTAEFSGLRSQYEIEGVNGTASDVDGDGFISVRHRSLNADGTENIGQNGADGLDKMKGVERLRFNDQTIEIVDTVNTIAEGRPILVDANNVALTTLPTVGQVIRADLSAIVDADNTTAGNRIVDGIGLGADGASTRPFTITWQAEEVPGSGIFTTLEAFQVDTLLPLTGPTLTITDALAGLNIRALVQFVDSAGVIEVVTSLPTGGTGGGGEIPDATIVPALGGANGILEDAVGFTIQQADLLAAFANPTGLTVVSVTTRTVRDPADPNGLEVPAGVVTTNQNGSFTFTPLANYNGDVIFEFVVSNGVTTNVAEASLIVQPVDDIPVDPVAALGTVSAGIGAVPVNFTLADLFGNTPVDNSGRPIDVDGERLTVVDPTAVTSPNATVAFDGVDTFTWTPDPGAVFAETANIVLNFEITDGNSIVAATATIDPVNDAATGSVNINDLTPTAGIQLSASSLLADVNGLGTVSYAWEASSDGGSTWNNVGAGLTFTPGAAEVGQSLRVVASFTDQGGTPETVASVETEAVAANNVATGAVTLSDLTPTEGQPLSLTANLDDLDGLGPFTFQWQSSSDNGVTWVNVPVTNVTGTSQTFTPAQTEVGELLRAAVSFVDGNGTPETVFSAATTRITGDLIVNGGGALVGNAGDDNLTGNNGGQNLTGNAGDDFLDGAGGNDTAVFAANMSGTTFGFNGAGQLQVTSAQGIDTLSNIENISLGGTNYTLTIGNDTNNALAGNSSILPALRNDAIFGQGGDDTITYGVTNFLGALISGRDFVDGGTNGATGDRFILQGVAAAETFRIYSNLDGSAAAAGLTGLNTNTEIVITRQVGGGAAVVVAELDNIEEITLNTTGITAGNFNNQVVGADTVQIIGNFAGTSLLPNTITVETGTANDTIDLSQMQSNHVVVSNAGGSDRLISGNAQAEFLNGSGNWVDFASSTSGVTVNLTNGGNIGHTSLAGVQNVAGSTHADEISGDSARNSLQGAAGDDQIDGEDGVDIISGGLGSDDLDGGTGNDYLHYYHSTNGVRVNLATGAMSGGDAEGDTIASFEHVLGSNTGDDIIVGDGQANSLFGYGGNDQILGGDGNDVQDGGVGNDLLIGGNGSDRVNGGVGDDWFVTTALDGNDTYTGDVGTDTLDMSAIVTNITANLSTGTANSIGSSDRFTGIENIVTGSGADRITASGAVNEIDGGAGNDVFIFRSAADANGDTITSFAPGDKIDLKGFMTGTVQVVQLENGQPSVGQVAISYAFDQDGAEYTILTGNAQGGSDVDFTINIKGHQNLAGSDFN